MRISLIIAASFFLIYGLLLQYGPKPIQTRIQSLWQENQYSVEKYSRDTKSISTRHQAVIVGSSMSKRLDFASGTGCTYNLALRGDSSLTGLNVIANQPEKPQVVLIEINIMDRSRNRELIERASGLLSQLSPIFHTENKPINLALSFVSQLETRKSPRKINEAVRLNAIALQAEGYNTQLPSAILDKNLTEMIQLVGNIEAKGTKAIFFEMPVHPELESTPRSLQIRRAFKSAFPNHKFLEIAALTGGVIVKTEDGLHLSPEEAKIVVKNMGAYFNDICPAN